MRKKYIAIGLGGVLFGALAVLVIRFVTYNPPSVHYHANFAVFINGTRQDFKGGQYYQEVNVCSLHGTTPAARVHMHDEVNNVVHVHDDAVTWGEFFQNIGWGVGQTYLATPGGIYVADDTNEVHVLLNGQDETGLSNIGNTVIHDKDQLLISYGNVSDSELTQQSKAVGNSAAKYDAEKDTSACSGAEGPTTHDRLTHLF